MSKRQRHRKVSQIDKLFIIIIVIFRYIKREIKKESDKEEKAS